MRFDKSIQELYDRKVCIFEVELTTARKDFRIVVLTRAITSLTIPTEICYTCKQIKGINFFLKLEYMACRKSLNLHMRKKVLSSNQLVTGIHEKHNYAARSCSEVMWSFLQGSLFPLTIWGRDNKHDGLIYVKSAVHPVYVMLHDLYS